MLALHSCDDFQLRVKKLKKIKKTAKSENFKTPYKSLAKYGSFSEFHTSTEKSVMLATLPKTPSYWLNTYTTRACQGFPQHTLHLAAFFEH